MQQLKGRYLSHGACAGQLVSFHEHQNPPGSIALVRDLRDLPRDWLSLEIGGVVTSVGGSTSHAVLQARAVATPVLLCDSVVFEELCTRVGQDVELKSPADPQMLDVPKNVNVLVNISQAADWDLVTNQRVDGIGMWRSEDFLIKDPETLRSVRSHRSARDRLEAAVQSEVEAMLSSRRSAQVVTVRVPDLTPDDLNMDVDTRTAFRLSLRGARLLLVERDILTAFLNGVASALASAARGASLVRLLLPLVMTPREVEVVRELWKEVAASKGAPTEIPIGVAIEVPVLAANPSMLAAVCDFASVGTNDLVQYAWALDRDEGYSDVIRSYLALGILDGDPFESLIDAGIRNWLASFGSAFAQKSSRWRFGITGDLSRDPGLLNAAADLCLDYVSLPVWATALV